MKRASVSDLKSSLSSYLRHVKRGEEVLVTERGRPIARLVPAPAEETMSERLQRLARAGLIRLPLEKPSPDLLKRPPFKDPEGKVLEALLEERRTGR